MLKRTELTRDPEGMFKEPIHVLESEELTTEDKVRVLENWKLDLMELQRASEENMESDEGDKDPAAERLQAVNETLDILRRETRSAPDSGA